MAAVHPISEADVAAKTVLVRADLNVPMEAGEVTDTTRIDRFAPTVKALIERGARVVVLSHFGRPKGKPNPAMSLKPVAAALSVALDKPIAFAPDCIGEAARAVVDAAEPGDVVMLENLRFHAGEEANDDAFAAQLASLGDIYVNDAFSCSHRAHASIAAITRHLPSYAGPSLMAELDALSAALDDPRRPVAALVGGAKVSTKIPVLENLIPRMDQIIVGGGMANTFLLAKGKPVGKSLAEPDYVDTARAIMASAEERNCELVLPVDVVVASEFAANAESRACGLDEVGEDELILDVGPRTVAELTGRLSTLKTLLWNGPLGAFEIAPFGEGTFAFARAAATATAAGDLITVAGGGDTVAALNAAGVSGDFTYVSTAGGAFLEWLEGKTLPGVAALQNSTLQSEEV